MNGHDDDDQLVDRLLDQLVALTEELTGAGEVLDRVGAVQRIRDVSTHPLVLARAGGYFLGGFLADPVANPRGLQAAALLDAAGAGREAHAVVVEAMNVRTRLAVRSSRKDGRPTPGT